MATTTPGGVAPTPDAGGLPVVRFSRSRHRASGLAGLAALLLVAACLTSCDRTAVVLEGTVTVRSAAALPSGVSVSRTGMTRPFGVGVDVVLYANDAENEVARTTTNVVGHYAFHTSQVADGTYRLAFGGNWWGGKSWADATPVTVRATAPVVVDDELTGLGAVFGHVVDSGGSGVSGVPVWATDAAGKTVAMTSTLPDGEFTLGLLDVGDYTVHLQGSSGMRDVGGSTPVVFDIAPSIPGISTNAHQAGEVDESTGDRLPLEGVVAVDGGESHDCALESDHTVVCWGNNGWGQGGNGTNYNIWNLPVAVTGIHDAVAMAAGLRHTCVIHAGGTVSCWGFNEDGELGDGTTGNSTVPVAVAGISDAVAITGGGFHTCVVHATGAVSCWGYNHSGELGDGTTTDSTVPVTVSGITDAVSITGGRYHTCAVHATGAVSCWGSNDYGAIGNGTDHNYFTTPVAVTGITDATAVDGGEYHTCALRAGGTVACWGANFLGGLGNGTYDDSNVPVTVTGIDDATAVGTGDYASCALRATGRVSCWGMFGVYADGQWTTSDLPGQGDPYGINDAVAIGKGTLYKMVVRSNGTVWSNESETWYDTVDSGGIPVVPAG